MARFFIILTILTVLQGCNISSKESRQRKGFYGTIAGWDINYIPLIPPYKAISTYPDQWSIDAVSGKKELIHQGSSRAGSIPVLSLGVSKNYIYGTTSNYSEKVDKWFLFNTNNSLYAEYSTEAELMHTLDKYQVDKKPIRLCNDYFKELAAGKACYWFPEKGDAYPQYPDFRPDSCIEINVKGDQKSGITFTIPGGIKKVESKIYYFKVRYDKKDNDLFYISFDSSSPVLIRNNMIVSAYAEGDYLDIAVYTPFPVGAQKGIKEKDRIVVRKSFQLKQ